MKTWQRLALLGSLFGALNLGFNSQSNAQTQTKKVRIVDAILNCVDSLRNVAGIPNLKITWDGNAYTTNSEGYVDLVTGVKDDYDNQNKDFLNVSLQNNSLNFSYNGNASIKFYDILGREIKSYDDSEKNINWDFTNSSNHRINSGTYFYVLNKNGNIKAGKLVFGKDFGVYLGNETNDKKANVILEDRILAKTQVLENQTLSIKDEEMLSTDGTNNLGEYFDIEANYSGLDEVPDTINMIPVLPFESANYRNILHFVKYITKTDGTTPNTRLKRFELPIKSFRNASTAPNSNYVAAFDSATSSNHDNSWESMTSFNHKGHMLPKMNLFEEVFVDPDTGITLDYTSNFSHMIFDKRDPNNSPLHAIVYVDKDNLSNNLAIISDTKHENGHGLFGTDVHSSDSKHAMLGGGGLVISNGEGKSIRIIYSLSNLDDIKIYKED
ncbi:MAG: hypothetical protein QT11_C0001G0084 [archaeon GW2011_AR20]|nr:MAG: hypothetical protein QT11_C0001G0084 [archaeon GW2011_AR20]MBS3160738.1 T9SS type A sorting domain-containing protein [Candidatus Woesearchaeota archaeon]